MARLAEQLTGRTWRDKNGAERPVVPTDILIVTPYNAQISVSCRTPHQMVLANALCRAWETGGGRGVHPDSFGV